MSTPIIDNVDVCIYHADCSDGFGAAWSVYKRFGLASVEYLPGTHANKEGAADYWIEKVTNKHVVCYDFSFSRELTEQLHTVAASFQVIDHHLSAQLELGDLDYCYFDMNKSGAVLAWESVFHPTSGNFWIFTNTKPRPVPTLLKYVQDRDLWKWELPDSKELWNYISSLPREFDTWNELSTVFASKSTRAEAAVTGKAMLNKVSDMSREIANDMEVWTIGGHQVAVANCPRVLRSDVCEDLGKGGKYPFVGCYQVEEGTATWSLRSNHGTEDVSAIAGAFPGGGGHAQAAGFTISVDRMDFVNRRVV